MEEEKEPVEEKEPEGGTDTLLEVQDVYVGLSGDFTNG